MMLNSIKANRHIFDGQLNGKPLRLLLTFDGNRALRLHVAGDGERMIADDGSLDAPFDLGEYGQTDIADVTQSLFPTLPGVEVAYVEALAWKGRRVRFRPKTDIRHPRVLSHSCYRTKEIRWPPGRGASIMGATVNRRGTLALGLGMIAFRLPAATVPRTLRGWHTLDDLAATAIKARLSPGLQLSVMERGRVVYSKAFGMADLERSAPFTPMSVSRIGSLAKQFTAAAILLLAEDGVLSLDDPLSRFLPEVPHSEQVTLRHLLTHTSGLGLSERVVDVAGKREHSSQSLLSALLSGKPVLKHAPGAQWTYNNFAYKLLGLVVERAAKTSYANFVRSRIAIPAELPLTAVDNDREIVPGRATGYIRDPATPFGFSHTSFESITWVAAAGSIRSTAQELCRWHQALLGGKVLKPTSLQAMLTPVRFNDTPVSFDVAEWGPSGPAERKQYGLGIYSGMHKSRRVVTHTGSVEGYLSQLTSYPTEQVSVAALLNVDRGNEGRNSPQERTLRDVLQHASDLALG